MNAAHRSMTPPSDEERAEDHVFTYARHRVLTGKLHILHTAFQNDLNVFDSGPL